MRVDYHLIRRMLEAIEAAPEPEIMFMPELTSEDEVQRYHLQLLIDGGYVTAKQLAPYRPPRGLALTLAGQELLDQLRRKKTASAGAWMERLLTASVMRLLLEGP